MEQFWRDSRLNPIHEGTHGIQALDLLGRKVTMQHGAALGLLAQRIQATIARAAAAKGAPAVHAEALQRQLTGLLEVTAKLWADADPVLALADASVYLEALGHVVVAWLWLDMELAAAGPGAFYAGKRLASQYFFTRELPKVSAQLDLLAARDGLMVGLDTDTL